MVRVGQKICSWNAYEYHKLNTFEIFRIFEPSTFLGTAILNKKWIEKAIQEI